VHQDENLRSTDIMMKICLVGDGFGGKSSLVARFFDDSFSFSTRQSIGVDFKFKTLCASGENIKLWVWDITLPGWSGKTRAVSEGGHMQNIHPDAIFVCYDTSEVVQRDRHKTHCGFQRDDTTFDSNLEFWMHYVKKYAPENVQIYVVGLKSDLPPSKEMEAYVRAMLERHELEAWRWITVSSKTGERVEIPFYAAVVKHVQKGANQVVL
jgi:GTPase SAR1 family protein